MQMIIVSGLSGAGKSVALHTLEDEGYFCVDNLPISMLVDLARKMSADTESYDRVAVGIDARGEVELLDQFESVVTQVRSLGVETQVVFLDAQRDILITRFSETRRKHPLSKHGAPLDAAIGTERMLLGRLEQIADVGIDTTNLNLHQLREVIRNRVIGSNRKPLNVLLQSFGFKHGQPHGTDFLFDVRCLPNPYWSATLRPMTGRDAPVAEFLQQHDMVQQMIDHIGDFFFHWIPVFESENRSYLTISIGCTGGRHRSVYVAEQVKQRLNSQINRVTVKHREIE
ncbi:RNase adaptor protein RapZ [Chromatiales bacterium (ex Bugula neritina AB1)]|nr:RNase adaptor protein RapZ [Chromatiales bacterium (ex Bugula neritina AB1)]